MSTPTKAPPSTHDAQSTEARADATLELIDRSLIEAKQGFNPRHSYDPVKLQELVESVRHVGVLQPITVVRSADNYELVVGHRRYVAACRAKLEKVPALVYDAIDDMSRLKFAIIENVQREDMNPIDEALAFQRAIKDGSLTQKQLASVIGKSPSHVSERLRLLTLPSVCRDLIASGALPLAAAKPLAAIAASKVPTAAQIADACARAVAAEDVELDVEEFLDNPTTALYLLASDEAPEGAPFLYRIGGYSQSLPVAGHVDPAAVQQLSERAERLGYRRFAASGDDTDAARAYGCLIEIETRYSTQRFITDPTFIVDRITSILDTIEAQRTAAPNAESPGSAPTSGKDRPIPSAAQPSPASEAQARQVQREQDDKARVAAIHANRELGVRLQKQLGSHKLDRPTIELLAHLVLAQNRELAARGIAYTHDEYHTYTQKRQKNGKTRTTVEPNASHEVHTQALEWVLRPRTAEEVLGRLLQLLVAGVFADDRAVAKSRRTHWSICAFQATEPIIAKLARKILPEHFHTRADRMLPKPTPKQKPKSGTKAKTTDTPGKTHAGKPQKDADASAKAKNVSK